MATYSSLDEILEKQCEKMQILETATIIIKGKDAVREELVKMRTDVSQMGNGIEAMRTSLSKMKEQNDQCRVVAALIEKLDKKIVHMEQNIPPELIHDYQKDSVNLLSLSAVSETVSPAIANDVTEKQDTAIRDCKKTLFKEPEVCPVIHLIDQKEFSTIPKYIIGRQSLETVNSFINSINQILKTKYTFLALGKAQARKQGDLNLYLQYKKQDLDVCTKNNYLYFFMAEDYEKHTNTKLNKLKLNLLTVLRHCKRLREHRVKNDLRYVILTKK